MDDHENERPSFLVKLAKVVAPFVHHAYVSALLGVIGATLPLLFKVFGEDSNIPLGALIGAVAGYFALNIITDRLAKSVLDVEISVVSLTVRLMRLSLAERAAAAKEMALSLTYLGKLKERHSYIKLALLVCAVALVGLSFRFPDLDLFEFATVSIAALGLLVLKEAVVEYRIRNGLFGTTRSEARELIDFIVENSDDIDFTDSNGNLRKALLPEDSKRDEMKPHFTPGGVTI
jgi:hypothetical protein